MYLCTILISRVVVALYSLFLGWTCSSLHDLDIYVVSSIIYLMLDDDFGMISQ